MKKIILLGVVSGGIILAAAGGISSRPVIKKSTAVTHAGRTNTAGNNHLSFKIAADTPADFAVQSVYVFTDKDRKTGRKGIGNEYFLDVPKSMISSYTADGKGTLHRKALVVERKGEWYTLIFSEAVAPDFANKDIEIVFSDNKGKRDRVVLPHLDNNEK